MKKTFVELYNGWIEACQGNTKYVSESLSFADWLDAQGIKPKKSRWVKFEATADSV